MSNTGATGTLPDEALDPGRGRRLHERVVEQAGDAVAVLAGAARRRRARGRRSTPDGRARCASSGQNFSLLHMMKIQPSCGAVELARHQARVAAARRAAGDRAAVQVPGAGVVEVVHRDVEERGVDVHADAGLARLDDAGEQAERRRQAGHQVDDRQAVARRRAVGLAGHRHVAGLGLHQVVVAGPGAARAAAAVGRQVGADDARVGVLQRRVVEAELGRQVAAQVVEHGVGAGDQALEHRHARRDACRSSVMLFLLRLKVWKKWLSSAPKKCGPTWRPTSPPSRWFSILITSAPRSARYERAERAGAVLLDGEHAQARQGKAGSGVGHGSLGCGDGAPRWRQLRRRAICTDNIESRGPAVNRGRAPGRLRCLA